METGSTAVCRMCYMEIDPRARKCPYCQHWRHKWSMITFHPLFLMIPLGIMFLLIFAFIGKTIQATFSEGEPFARHADAVSIVEGEMVFGTSGCEHESPTVAILGKIVNESPFSWASIQLEATFFG